MQAARKAGANGYVSKGTWAQGEIYSALMRVLSQSQHVKAEWVNGEG